MTLEGLQGTERVLLTTIPGDVTMLQATGSDDTLACAALVYDEFDTITLPQARHYKLVDEMVKAGHFGCLDYNIVTFKIDCPIFVARQIMRSSNMNFNEISGRYLEFYPLFYGPREFHTDVKRKELGNAPEPVEDQESLRHIYVDACKSAYETYSIMLAHGVRKEQARMVLPLNAYTSFWMSGRLSDWLHFLNLRLDSHAQAETQYVASLIFDNVHSAYPKTVENWVKYAKGPLPSGCIQTP
jgi:thymidylate synthase (FAD)